MWASMNTSIAMTGKLHLNANPYAPLQHNKNRNPPNTRSRIFFLVHLQCNSTMCESMNTSIAVTWKWHLDANPHAPLRHNKNGNPPKYEAQDSSRASPNVLQQCVHLWKKSVAVTSQLHLIASTAFKRERAIPTFLAIFPKQASKQALTFCESDPAAFSETCRSTPSVADACTDNPCIRLWRMSVTPSSSRLIRRTLSDLTGMPRPLNTTLLLLDAPTALEPHDEGPQNTAVVAATDDAAAVAHAIDAIVAAAILQQLSRNTNGQRVLFLRCCLLLAGLENGITFHCTRGAHVAQDVDWCPKSSSSTFWGCLFGTWFSTQFRKCNFVNYREFITFGPTFVHLVILLILILILFSIF